MPNERPGWVTFAAIMMFVAGGLMLVLSIEEFSDAAWLSDFGTGLLADQITTWAIIDLIIAIVTLIAGYSIWNGGKFGFWFGVIVAGLHAMRWFFYIPWVPLMAMTIILIDVLIIYGLASNKDYFD